MFLQGVIPLVFFVMKLSLLIPCYNEEKTIRSCVSSCLNQTRKFDQIVVVNDGNYFVDLYESDASQEEVFEFLKSSRDTASARASFSLWDEDFTNFCGNSIIYNPERMF